MRNRRLLASLALLIATVAIPGVPTVGHAQRVPSEDVLPREIADELLNLWNAPGTLRVDGPYTVEAAREVPGDIGVIGGELVVAGHVAGRIVGVNADVRLTRGARVDGEILVVGGRVTGSDVATVGGQIRAYRARLDYTRDGNRIVRRPESEEPQRPWWHRRERRHDRAWGDLRLISARTYNRVEGLPVYLGPAFGRDLGWGRISVDALGVWRSADGFEWSSENIGHSVKTELQFGERGGLRVGGRLFDIVDPVEPWQLSDEEVGLASFFLHRDFRDYFNRHGGSVYASLFHRTSLEASVAYSDQRWADRRTRDPWTLFRNTDPWRENPEMDEGNFHLVNGSLRYDTRNDEGNPWSGWYINAEYEYGTGTISRYAPVFPEARQENVGGQTVYDRLFLDVRRYNRIAPDASINVRLAAGGWLSGDDLPLQRRYSVGGPGSLPGYDFRRTIGTPDVWQCGSPQLASASAPLGTPALCERFALAQVEFRGDLKFDLFGVLDEERDRRRAGWGRGTQWVLFADAGRGWMVGTPDDGLTYRRSQLPSLGTFRTDLGFGLVLDDVGIYVAKSISDRSAPANVFVRLKPRF